jgi:hypothetical protein
LKRDEVKFIACTSCNIKRLEDIYILLLEDVVIMFGKMVQRPVEPGDIDIGFDGDVVLMGKSVDDGDDRSAPAKKNCSLQSRSRVSPG